MVSFQPTRKQTFHQYPVADQRYVVGQAKRQELADGILLKEVEIGLDGDNGTNGCEPCGLFTIHIRDGSVTSPTALADFRNRFGGLFDGNHRIR